MDKYTLQNCSIHKKQEKQSLDWELYNLFHDPYEEHNLATSKPDLVSRMAKEFGDWAHAIQLEKVKNWTKTF